MGLNIVRNFRFRSVSWSLVTEKIDEENKHDGGNEFWTDMAIPIWFGVYED